MSGARKVKPHVKPHFENGRYEIKGFWFEGSLKKTFELKQSTWLHIIKDRSRFYFKNHFGKIEATLKKPERILPSNKGKDLFIYERFFDDFFIGNTVLGRVYLYVVVNSKTCRIITVYFNPRKKRKKQIWPMASK